MRRPIEGMKRPASFSKLGVWFDTLRSTCLLKLREKKGLSFTSPFIVQISQNPPNYVDGQNISIY